MFCVWFGLLAGCETKRRPVPLFVLLFQVGLDKPAHIYIIRQPIHEKRSPMQATIKKSRPQNSPTIPKPQHTSHQTVQKKSQSSNRIACLKIIGDNGSASTTDLSVKLKVPRTQAAKTAKELSALSLIRAEKNQRTTLYTLTTAGFVALVAFDEFKDWTKIKSALAVPQKKNDPLAYALLVVGFCANKPDGVYQALCRYGAQGNTIENIPADVSAESLLKFYRQELRAQSPSSTHLSWRF